MAPKKSCRTVLISDAPASEDAFGPHQQLAKALANLIQTEDGGKSIALEGRWGSGKSTIVKLFENQFSKDPDTTVLIFDAWAHQGDPLRRTFLESLIDALKGRWVKEEYWEEKKDELARRKKVALKTSIPQLKPLGVWIAIGAFFIPLGLALFNSALRDGLTFAWTGWRNISYRAVLGVGLATNPLIIYAIRYFCWRLRMKRGETILTWDETGGWNAIFAQKYTIRERTETIEHPDPTSIEFERVFTELTSQALAEPSHRIVLVLDNLDRVNEADARAILATLQTFLHDRHSRDEEWFRRLWILIPYAPEGIKRLWQVGKKDFSSFDENAAKRFIEKRFQVRFEVPPLVLSDWHRYLDSLLAKAFPSHRTEQDRAQFHAIYRLFAVKRTDQRPPTPRDLKLFVNQIGTIHRQWGDKFPFSQMAYYVLLQEEHTEIIGELREGKLPEANVVSLLGKDVKRNLAAMAFNTDVDRASQLLLGSPLVDALQEGNSSRLTELAEEYPEGFWVTLEGVPFGDWAQAEGNKLADAARAICESEAISCGPSIFTQSVLDSLDRAVRNVQQWPILDESVGKGIVSLLHLKPDLALANHVLKTACSFSFTQAKTEDLNDRIDSWVDGLVVILLAIDSLDLGQVFADGIKVPGGSVEYIRVCSRLGHLRVTKRFWSLLQTTAKPPEITEQLRSVVSQGNLCKEYVPAIGVLEATALDIDWQSFVDELATRLRVETALEPTEVVGLLAALHRMETVERASSMAKNKHNDLANRGFILNQLHHTRRHNEYLATAWCIFSHLDILPDANLPSPAAPNAQPGKNFLVNDIFRKPENHEELLDRFVELVVEQDKFDMLFRILDSNAQPRPFIATCCKKAIELSTPPTDSFVARRHFFKETLGEKAYQALVRDTAFSADLLRYVQDGPFDVDQADLYLDLLEAGAKEDPKFRNWCIHGLQTVDQETWQATLEQERELIELLTWFHPTRDKATFGLQYLDALKWYGRQVAEGHISPSKSDLEWEKLPRFLGKAHRKILRQDLIDAAKEAKGAIPDSFFDLYGNEIQDLDIFKDDRRVVSTFFTPVVQKRNHHALRWLNDFLSKYPNFLERYEPEYAVKEFDDRVRDALDVEENEAIRVQLEKIAGVLRFQGKLDQAQGRQSEEN